MKLFRENLNFRRKILAELQITELSFNYISLEKKDKEHSTEKKKKTQNPQTYKYFLTWSSFATLQPESFLTTIGQNDPLILCSLSDLLYQVVCSSVSGTGYFISLTAPSEVEWSHVFCYRVPESLSPCLHKDLS